MTARQKGDGTVVPIREPNTAPGIRVIPMPPGTFIPARDFGLRLAEALLDGSPPPEWKLPRGRPARYVYVLGVARGMLTHLSSAQGRA